MDAAISWAQAAVDLDPLEEASQRRLMALLAAAGQRSQALRQYERCRSLLAQSLETEPDEETEALRAEIAGGGIAVEKRPVSPVTPATGTAPEPGPPPSAGMVFLLASTGRVGHDGEMRSVFPTGPAAINAAIKLLTTSTARRPRGRGARRTPPADHAVLSQLATAAVVRAAETGREPVHGSVQVVSKLYYLVMTRATLDGIRAALAPTIFTIDGITRDPVPWPDWAVTAELDTTPLGKTVWSAVQCHRTQIEGRERLARLDNRGHRALWGFSDSTGRSAW